MQQTNSEDRAKTDNASKLARLDRRVTALESGPSMAGALHELSAAIKELCKVMPIGDQLVTAVYELRESIRRCM